MLFHGVQINQLLLVASGLSGKFANCLIGIRIGLGLSFLGRATDFENALNKLEHERARSHDKGDQTGNLENGIS